MSTPDLALSLPRWAKLALYLTLLILPGGSLGLLLIWWLGRLRANTAPRYSA